MTRRSRTPPAASVAAAASVAVAAAACAALVVTGASPPLQTVLCNHELGCDVTVGWNAADVVNSTTIAVAAGWAPAGFGRGAPTSALGPGPTAWYEPLADM
jgi:hypothetical protein